jgi:hypothetical protein
MNTHQSDDSKSNTNREREGAGQSGQKRPLAVPPAGNVQYRYAVDDTGTTVDVKSLKPSANLSSRSFRCLACAEPMIPHLGTQLAHHFAHKSNSQCSGETYLHQLAKRVFCEEFEWCRVHRKPFQIELPQRLVCNHHGQESATVCQTKPKLRLHDLVPGIASIRVEKKANEFVPDVTLVGKENIWVEFAVSHACSPAKLKARQKIIEIRIQSEADVDLFRHHKLSAHDGRVKFINFPDRVPNDMCRWYKYCRLAKRVFVIHHNRKLEIQYLLKHQDVSQGLKAKAAWWTEEYINQGDQPQTQADYEFLLREAALKWDDAARAAGQQIRACGLCVHYDGDGDDGCLKHKAKVPWHEALQCSDFTPNQDWSDAEPD